MKIAVIGTSNSILRQGYVAGLGSLDGVSVDNFSLGASVSVVLPKVTGETAIGGYDFVVIDFAVNEEAWVRLGQMTVAEIREQLVGLMALLSPGLGTLVVAVLPTLDGLGAQLPVHRFYREFALEHGCPLFDGFVFAERFAAATGFDARLLFMDAHHLAREVAFRYGASMAAALKRMLAAPPPRRLERRDTAAFAYRVFGQADTAGGTPVHRQTSIAQAELVRLEGDQTITFTLPGEHRLIGIGVNLAQSNDRVLLSASGETRELVLYGGHYKGDGISLIYVMLPVRGLSGTRFEIAPKTQVSASAVVEIIGVTLRGAPYQVEVPVLDLPPELRDWQFDDVTP